jgi:hypothetical protein
MKMKKAAWTASWEVVLFLVSALRDLFSTKSFESIGKLPINFSIAMLRSSSLYSKITPFSMAELNTEIIYE